MCMVNSLHLPPSSHVIREEAGLDTAAPFKQD